MTETTTRMTALVLAGQRSDVRNPLAVSADVSHKCLVPVAGRPLIAHVLKTLIASPLIGDVIVSIDLDVFGGIREAEMLCADGRLHFVEPSANIADSIIAAAATVTEWPLLITTADNVLLTTDAVARMRAALDDDAVDGVAGMAPRSAVQRAHPIGQKRFYEFADTGYANCNLYAIGNAKALRAAEVFREGGQFARNPKRLLTAFGLLNVIRYRFKLATLEGTFRNISRRFGVNLRPVVFEDGALAIDVDNERTHGVAETILLQRQAA